MKRRKRKKRRRWTADDGCLECKRGEQLLVAKKKRQETKTGRQIRLRAMPVGRARLDPKFGHNLKMAKLAAGRAPPPSPPGVLANELFSERRNFSASHSSRAATAAAAAAAASATRVVHFAGSNSRNKQFMRSLGCSLWLLASCLSAASESGGGLPHLQQQHISAAAAVGQISARRTAADDDSTSFITEELSWPRAETSGARLQLHDDDDDKQDEQSVFVPLAPINEQRHKRTRATVANATTTLQDQDQRATDPALAELDNLPAGSRLVVAREGQQIELACDAREFAPVGELATTRNEREFIISGPNKTLRRLEPMNRDKDEVAGQRARLGLIQTNNVVDDLDADQLTDRLVSLVFWYKDDDPAPIYTLDARPGASKLTGGSLGPGAGNEQRLVSLNKQLLGAAKHYERNRTDHEGTTTYDWRSRIIADEWPVIGLQLNGVRGSHWGDYKCRVDFRRARTIRRVIRLFVEVPLQSLSLTLSDNDNNLGDINLVQTNRSDVVRESSAQDQNHTEIVRLNQEQRAEFVCRANEGARPRPILSWLVSWPSTSPSPGPSKVEEFFVSSESQARLARLLNGSIAGVEAEEDERSGRKHRETKWKESSKDLGRTSALSSSGGGSKLILNRLARSMLGLRVGCRARQPKLELPNDEDETADSKRRRRRLWQPLSADHAHMVSQGANWTGAAAAARSAPLELTKWLELELNLRPESVRISRLLGEQQQQTPTPGNKVTGPEVRTGGGGGGGEPRPGEKLAEEVQKVSLDEREPITFVCTTRGARPPARLSWSWSGGGGREPIGRLTTSGGGGGAPKIIDKTSTSDGELESTSQVEFPHGLARQWHGRKLLCAATNEATGGTAGAWQPAVAHLELDIRYKPTVQLIERAEIGGSQRRRFECLYQANPPINQLVWLVNGRPLVPTSHGQLINKTNGHGFDQAEIKQVAGRPSETKGSATIRKHNKLFHFETAQIFAPTDSARESDDDELMATVEHNQGDLAKRRSGTPEIAAAAAASGQHLLAFVTIDELEDKETSGDERMVELKCAAVNELGELESEPLVWESPLTIGRAEPKCRIDERLAALRSQSTLNLPDRDSLLGQLEVHSLVRDWPSDDKFSCQLESNTTGTRYAWSFVPFDQIAERASGWAKWPADQPRASDQMELFSQSSELIGAAEKLLPPPPPSPLKVAANLSRSVHGLLLCKAQLDHSQEWWPRSGPCLTLVVSGARENDQKLPEATPSTENCRIEPILVQGHHHHHQAKGDWVAAPQPQQPPPPPSGEEEKSLAGARNERLAISVDCSAAPGKESLIFELGVARRVASKPDQTTAAARDAISRQQQPPPPPPGQLDDLMLLDERSSAKTKNKTKIQHQLRAAKKLLFTESVEKETDTTTSVTGQGYRRLALSDLIPSQDFVPKPRQSGANDNNDGEQDEPTERKESEGGRGAVHKLDDKTREANKQQQVATMEENESAGKLHQAGDESAQSPTSEMSSSSGGGGGATSSLNEQVELLNELVFTLRASDLVRTSEPRAIYGSELRLAKRAPAAAAPLAPRRTKSSQRGGSSETGGVSAAAVSLSRSAELLQLLASEQSATPTSDVEGRGWHNISQASRSRHLDLVEWGRRHEVGITMVAIGATVLLSGLTLTLIVLVLRRNQRQSPPLVDMTGDNNNNSKSLATANGYSSQRPSELVLMRSGSRVSLASRQHRPSVESPLSSECHHNSTSQKTNNNLLNADHHYHQHKHLGGSLLGDCYLTDDLAAVEFAASLAGSQVCLSSQVDFLAPPAHQLRGQQSQRTSSSSSQCTTSYTLTNSRRPPRQLRLNLSPQSIGELEDTQTTIVEHTDYLHHHRRRHPHYLNSLPRGHYLSGAAPPPPPPPPASANCDARNLLPLPDLQVAAHGPGQQFCQHQHQLIFEHQQQLAPTTDCSFEQSPSLMSVLSDPIATTGSLSQGHQPTTTTTTCHLILEPLDGQLQLASDFDEEQDT